MDSVKTPELDASFDEPDTTPSSQSLQVFYSINPYKLRWQAMLVLLPVPLTGKMSASELICCFFSHSVAFEFWDSTPQDNITLNPDDKKTDQSLSDFQTGIATTTHATSETDCICWYHCLLQASDRGIIPVTEMHGFFYKIHDILDNALSKCFGKTADILAFLFKSVSRHHHEVWASQFCFLHKFKDTVSPSKVCLYGHITCSLAQAQKQSSPHFSQTPISMRCGKAIFWFNLQTQPIADSIWGPMAKSLTCKLELGVVRVAGSYQVVHIAVLSIIGRREAVTVGIPDVLQPAISSTSSVVQAGTLPQSLHQWSSITSYMFVLNVVQDQGGLQPILYLKWFNHYMSFWANGHEQLWQLFYVILSDMLNFYILQLMYFFPFIWPFQHCIYLSLSQFQYNLVPMQFPLPDVFVTIDATYDHWVFYFQVSTLLWALSFCRTWSDSMFKVYIAL